LSGGHPVEIAGVTHRYGDRTALNDVTLSVEPGQVFGLLGPNGGGKTTLFKILSTLLAPTAGRAFVLGKDVVADAHAVRRQIGIVFQSPSVDGQLTVLENLLHHGMIYGRSGSSLRREARVQLERFGLSDRATERVVTLSGGLRRRVELAKVMLHEPQVLILDEPSTGLDPGVRAELMDHLHRLRDEKGVTSLLTTHLLEEAERCDALAFLDRGMLVAVDTPDALKRSIGSEVVSIRCASPEDLVAKVNARFATQGDVVDGVIRLEAENGHTLVPEIIEAFPGTIDSVTVGRPTLEDVFVHLTGHRLWGEGGAEAASAEVVSV